MELVLEPSRSTRDDGGPMRVPAWPSSAAQRGQVHPRGTRLIGEERVIAFDMPGTTGRHRGALRAQRQTTPDRHRRPAPARQGLRGGREVLGHQDPAGGRAGQRGGAGARRQPGDLRPGRPYRRLCGRGGRAWWWPSTNGTASTITVASASRKTSSAKLPFLGLPKFHPTFRPSRAGHRADVEGGRWCLRGGDDQAGHPADPPAPRRHAQATAAAATAVSVPRCVTPTRAG